MLGRHLQKVAQFERNFLKTTQFLILKYPYSGWLSFSGIVAQFEWNMQKLGLNDYSRNYELISWDNCLLAQLRRNVRSTSTKSGSVCVEF